MRERYSLVVAALLVVLLICLPGLAQDKKKFKSASLDGVTGLFRTWDAEALRQGEVNFSLGFSHYNRDPGELVFKTVPVALSIGITDRVEFFALTEVQKRIEGRSIASYRLFPGQFPRPAQTLRGLTSFSNEAPFLDVPRASGRGDTTFGGKVNILSERRGEPFAMALVGFINLVPNNEIVGLSRGLARSGKPSGGTGFLFSKRAGKFAELHLNSMFNFAKEPEINGNRLADLQHEFWYRGGASIPTYGRAHLIAEIEGKTYFGSRMLGLNPRSPVDLIVGMRFFPREWLSFGAGYRASLNHVKEDLGNRIYPAGTNGFVAQLATGMRRNDPPTVTCAVANASIIQDQKTTVRASGVDTDGDTLVYSWTSSGGKLSGTGDTATFDATDVAPGKYTVTATVSDGKHEASCSSEITVIKKNLAPTVSCEPGSVTVTQGESATIRSSASDPNNDKLTYTWTVDGQKLAADGPTVTFGSEGRRPGTYKVSLSVSDGEFTASCSTSVTVKELIKPNRPPTIECLTPTVDVASGSSAELKVGTSDPDSDRVSVSWSATGGSVGGSGDTATFNASGVRAGSYTVTATADDGRGGKASCSMTVNVSEKLTFAPFGQGSSRVDNVMKAALDDLATRMKNDSRLKANIVGYADGSKREAKKIGQKRAEAVSKYLQQKGVEESRLTVTDGGNDNPIGDVKKAAGRKQNRRVEIELSVR